MKYLITMLVAFALAACGGVSGGTVEPEPGWSWDPVEGLTVPLPEAVPAGAEVEIVQLIQGPENAYNAPMTLDGVPIAPVTFEPSSAPDGLAEYRYRFTRPVELPAGTVVGHKLVRVGDGTLVEPVGAWVALDATE